MDKWITKNVIQHKRYGKIILQSPISMFSTASSIVTPSFVTVLTNGYKLQTTSLQKNLEGMSQSTKKKTSNNIFFLYPFTCYFGRPFFQKTEKPVWTVKYLHQLLTRFLWHTAVLWLYSFSHGNLPGGFYSSLLIIKIYQRIWLVICAKQIDEKKLWINQVLNFLMF